MIELTDEMREALATAIDDRTPVIAASADASGQPKIAYYGSTHVHGPDQLAIWVRDPNAGFLKRIAENERVAFMYRNGKAKRYWQFYGRARVVDDEPTREAVYEGMHEIERLFDPDRGGVAVVIDLDKVEWNGGAMTR